jgi:hypothetical protein
MFQTLHAGLDGNLYNVELDGMADIADLVCEEHLESPTSTDGVIDFWLTPSLQPSHRHVNGTASELSLATTRFSARSVPPLRGDIVLAGHDSDGSLAGLTDAQIHWLVNSEPSRHDKRVLAHRFSRDERRQRRENRSNSETTRNSLQRPWR